MQYIFKGKNGYFKANVWEDNNHTDNPDYVLVSVHTENGFIDKETLKDDKGWYFFHEEEKFYISDWVRIPMRELLKKLETEDIPSDVFCQSILSEGISNIRFLVPFKINGSLINFLRKNKVKEVACHIEERTNRMVKQNFRIILVPDNPEKDIIEEEDISTDKLLCMIKEGYIKILE